MMTSTGELFQKAFSDHKEGKLCDAEKGYNQVLDLDPDHPSALHLLGLIKFDTGNLEQSIPLVERSVQLAPGEFQWFVNFGKILSKAQRIEQSVSAYEKALAINPHSVEAEMALGDRYCELGRFTEASKIYYKMLCETPNDTDLRDKYGTTLQALGHVQGARDLIVRLAGNHNNIPDDGESEVAHHRTTGAEHGLPPMDRKSFHGGDKSRGVAENTSHNGLAVQGETNSPGEARTFPTGKLDPVSECGVMADALYRMGYRESAGLYASHGLLGMLNGKKPRYPFNELLRAWKASTPGGFFARMWVDFQALSMYYAAPDEARTILEYWTTQERNNPEPFLRLGLLIALTASRKGLAAPARSLAELEHAHSILNNERSAAALSLAKNGQSLRELILPYDGGHLCVYPDIKNLTTYVLLEQADWFEKDIDLFRTIIRPGDKILDLGANVGVYSISAARRAGDRGTVISLEPCTVTYGLLKNSSGPFTNIQVILAAAADVSGRGVLEPDSGPEMMRLGAGDGEGEAVDIITVDELADREGIEYFDLIKMDVEGVEERVLAGAKRTLGNGDPVILFEITKAGIALVEVFRKLGFDSYYYCPPRKTIIRYREGDGYDGFTMNMIAIRPSGLKRFEGIVDID